MQDDRKGDAYMNALQPLTATCPWIPIIGNHEGSDGDKTKRYLNLTWGETLANPLEGSTSTATTALGHVLTKGTFLGAGLHGTTPSGTSAYFSVDVGQVHIAAMSTITPAGDELAWLEKDLAAADANRKNVPWIIVTSHYQIYLSSKMERDMTASSAYVFDAVCFVYTCRRLIDLSLIAGTTTATPGSSLRTPRTHSSRAPVGFASYMMNVVSNMMNFVSNMMNYVSEMMNFVS